MNNFKQFIKRIAILGSLLVLLEVELMTLFFTPSSADPVEFMYLFSVIFFTTCCVGLIAFVTIFESKKDKK
jgi:hypothetical protein